MQRGEKRRQLSFLLTLSSRGDSTSPNAGGEKMVSVDRHASIMRARLERSRARLIEQLEKSGLLGASKKS